MDGELLASGGGGAGEHDRVRCPRTQGFEYRLVVEKRVVVVHFDRVRAVVVGHVGRNPFAEVGFEGVYSHIEEGVEVGAEQLARGGVGEVYDAHARLPFVNLPDIAVGAGEEVAVCFPFGEEGGALGDVGVDPDAKAEAARFEAGEHPRGVGEGAGVPLEVAPVEFAHPKAVEMEDVDGEVAGGHVFEDAGDGGFVVVGGEGGGQPQAERPRRGQGGASGEGGVFFEDFFGGGAIDDEVFEGLVGDAELDAGDFFGGDFERDASGVVDKDAVAAVGEVEGDVFVGLFAGGAAIFVPDVYGLPVFDEGGKAFAQPVDVFAHAEGELFVQVVLAPVGFDDAHAFVPAPGEDAPIGEEFHAPRVPPDSDGEASAGEGGSFFITRHDIPYPFVTFDVKRWSPRPPPLPMFHPHADHIPRWAGEVDGEHFSVEGVAAVADGGGGGVNDHGAGAGFEVVGFGGVVGAEAFADFPVAVGEFHEGKSLF